MKSVNLVAVPCADRDTLAAFGAPAREDRGAALRLHAAAEAVRLRTAAAIGLKRTLGHGKTSLLNFFDFAWMRIASLRSFFADAQQLGLAAQ
jgi:hypothetical protein